MTSPIFAQAARHILATTALSLVLTSGAYAVNDFNITNVGTGNVIIKDQSGDAQGATGTVNGTNNSLSVIQSVWGNKLTTNTFGADNRTTVNTTGGNNIVSTAAGTSTATTNGTIITGVVSGEANNVSLSAKGPNDNVGYTVRGAANKVTVSAANPGISTSGGNKSSGDVEGFQNEVNVTSTGSNSNNVLLNGANNKATLTQNQNVPATANFANHNAANLDITGETTTTNVSQTGTLNVASVRLSGTNGTRNATTQTGANNSVSSTLLGNNNANTSVQTGNNNVVTTLSTLGIEQTASVTQTGDNNQASASATGETNSVVISQTGGNGNTANGINLGRQNTVQLTQAGTSNSVTGAVNGSFNTLAATQTGSNNSIQSGINGDRSLIGSTNSVLSEFTQTGNNNDAKAFVKASNSQITSKQIGNFNVNVVNNAGNGNSVFVQQTKDNNRANVSVTDAQWNNVKITQDSTGAASGTGNTADVNISSFSDANNVLIDQQGSNSASVLVDKGAIDNDVTVSQKGTNSASIAIQPGSITNSVVLAQDGTGNSFSAVVTPAAYLNQGTFNQKGLSNTINWTVQGEKNTADVTQNGVATLELLQNGANNHVKFTQTGAGNIALGATIQQFGNGKDVNMTQTSNPKVVIVQQ